MKLVASVLLVLTLVLLIAIPSLGFAGWENCIWVSQGIDSDGVGKRIGYLHQGEFMIKNVSQISQDGAYSFDLSVSNTLISFSNTSGLYGELGVNMYENFNLLFGGGYKYQSSKLLITVGSKYNLNYHTLNTEAEGLILLFNPLALDLCYNFNTKDLFVGLGVSFH
jgi:hypothetical protein